MTKRPSEKILAQLKGLNAQMREGEEPLFSIPAIWENATAHQSNACDLVLTNQRLFGYIYTTFPREHLFLDALELGEITAVTLRQKNFQALFRELFVSDGKKRVYIRATRQRIEAASAALRTAIRQNAPQTYASLGTNEQTPAQTSQPGDQAKQKQTPIYSEQRVRRPLERSPLGVALLLLGGLLLEVIGVAAWIWTGSAQTGSPLCVAGVVAVVVATLTLRQLRAK